MMYEHMNAKKGSFDLFTNPAYIAEEKFDGFRFIYEHGHMWTRNGHDKAAWLPSIVSRFAKCPGLVLDMEVLLPGGTSKDMQHFVGTKTPGDDSQLIYKVFDLLEKDGRSLVDLPFCERRMLLEAEAEVYGLDITTVYVHEDFEELYDQVTSRGGEGLMLKNTQAIYQPGKRPANTWYKFKKHDTADVVITGYTRGTGKNINHIGSICFVDAEGRTGKCAGMDDDTRSMFTAHKAAFIGRTIEISYMEKTPIAYRHPIFVTLREDK